MVWLGVLLAVAGALLVGVGIAAMRGALPLQGWIGIRTGATMSSQAAWDAAHRAGGVWLVVAGVVFALGGILVAVAENEDQAAWISLAVAGVGLVPVVVAGVAGHRAARSVAAT